jgi:hypothetical protein
VNRDWMRAARFWIQPKAFIQKLEARKLAFEQAGCNCDFSLRRHRLVILSKDRSSLSTPDDYHKRFLANACPDPDLR